MGKIRIGSPIFCRDGKEAGEVDRVVIDPESGRVTHVVAREQSLLTRDVVLPIEVVQDWRDEAVYLALGVLDLEGLPDYAEADYVSPAAAEIPAGPYHHGEVLFPVTHAPCATPPASDLTPGKEVECRGGVCGVVVEVLLDPVTGQVISFRLRRGGEATRDLVVPVEWVLDARGARVRIDCNVGQLEEALPVTERAAGMS